MPDIESVLLGNQKSSAWDELQKEFLDDRVIIFNDSVDDDIVENIIAYIIKWNSEDKHIPIENRKKIRIFITSPGGSTFSGNILTDVILQSKTPIMGIALDLVASAAYCSFLACHERIGFYNSIFLQHEGEIAIENSRSKAKQTSDFMDTVELKAKEFILSRTNFTSEQYDDIYDVEYWMDATKAKELGVIHKIIGEDCDLDYVL